MVTAGYNDVADRYEVYEGGSLQSTHQSASAAKSAAKRLGRRTGEAVHYKGPRMTSFRKIQGETSAQSRSGSSRGNSGLGDLLGGL